jgi:hypothetical protein
VLVDEVRVYERISADKLLATRNQFLDHVLSTRKKSCPAPWGYVAVLADGKITLCCHDILGAGGGIEANVADSSLLGIWHGAEFRRVRRCFLTGKFGQVPACRSCEAWAGEHVYEDLSTDKYIICYTGCGVSYRRRQEPATG